MALLTIVDDERALAQAAAARIAALIEEAVRARAEAHVCLTGGNTPRRTYELLAGDPLRKQVPWEHVHLYWGDERHVPPDHPDSNFGMARDALIAHVSIPASHVHRIQAELPADEAARLYERELPAGFDITPLGVGDDAHIASIFPDTSVMHDRRRGVVAVSVPHLKAHRITLTPPALLASENIIVIVAGAAKANAAAAFFNEPTDVQRYPVHLLREAGNRVEWFIDRAAARGVPSQRA